MSSTEWPAVHVGRVGLWGGGCHSSGPTDCLSVHAVADHPSSESHLMASVDRGHECSQPGICVPRCVR